MAEINLEDRYPDLQPISGVPPLGEFFGCGLRFQGKRNHDPEIASFLMNYSFCLLTIPILNLRCYRLIQTGAGTAVVGREPLSGRARVWNVIAIAAILLSVTGYWWHHHTSSPEYIAGQKISRADTLAEEGDLDAAARIYLEVAGGETSQKTRATEQLAAMLAGPLQSASPDQAATVLKTVVQAVQFADLPRADVEPFEHGMHYVTSRENTPQKNEAGQLEVLSAIAPLATDRAAFLETNRRLLERLVELQPQAVDFASQLAVVYEEQDKLEMCEALLVPHRDRLGNSEGARILGQIDARAGRFDDAYPLLDSYVSTRLNDLHRAEKEYTATLERLQTQVFEQLKSNKGPKSLYRQLESANERRQAELVNQYIEQQIKDDPSLRKARAAIMKTAVVVPVAMQLGMTMLQRARQATDPQHRQDELKKTEQLFLALRGFASDSSEYQLSLGEVYYWLGKQDEGRKLFDDYLEKSGRSHEELLAVAAMLRNLGSQAEARALAEESYNAADNKLAKSRAASLRAVSSIDIDERITWYRRAGGEDSHVQAQLEGALADRALRDGETETAVRHIRRAIEVYEEHSESVASLNNASLLYGQLFTLTGELDALEQRTSRMQRAALLDPDDSIVLGNAADALLSSGMRQVIGDSIDLGLLRMIADVELLSYLYDDTAGRDKLIAKVQANQKIKQALNTLDQALVLAPKRPQLYSKSLSLRAFLRDEPALQQIKQKIEEARPDSDDALAYYRDVMAGKKDAELRKSSAESISNTSAIVAGLPPDRNDATVAVAASTLAGLMTSAWMVGVDVDVDKPVELSERAYAAVPSSATRTSLVNSLLFRATLTLDDDNFRSMFSAVKRESSPSSALIFAMSQSARIRSVGLQNPDVQRVIELIAGAASSNPAGFGPVDWNLLHLARPSLADSLREELGDNRIRQLSTQIAIQLAPMTTAGSLIREYFNAELNNDAAKKEQLLETIRSMHPTVASL